MPVYKPRVAVRLYVPDVGTPSERVQQEDDASKVTALDCRAWRVHLNANSLNEADECEVMLSYDDAGLDPRILRNAEMYVWIDDVADELVPTANNLRFMGIACDVERAFSGSSGKSVRVRALDYTTLFLASKNYPASGVPDFSQTLPEAWARICDNTGYYDLASKKIVSTVQRLRDRIDITGDIDPSITLGAAVSPRLAKIGKLQVRQGSDAWAVWQTAVGSLGLVSFIRGDRVIVTTATDYYTADDPPRLIWGKNVVEISEVRDVNSLSSKNVGIESFDPLTGKTIEAFWPPLSYVQGGKGQKKKLAASAMGQAVGVKASDYEIFDCPVPTTDPAVAELVARRIWEERSRQELMGHLKTAEMFVSTPSGGVFDLLSLQGGDRIRVEIERSGLTIVQRLDSLQDRQSAIKDMGYSDQMADYIARNLDAITRLPPEFQVHSVSTTLETQNAEGGTYEQEIRYLNRIDVSGGSQAGTGSSVPAVTGQKS